MGSKGSKKEEPESNEGQLISKTIVSVANKPSQTSRVSRRVEEISQVMTNFFPDVFQISDKLIHNIHNVLEVLGPYAPPQEYLDLFKYSTVKPAHFMQPTKLYQGQWNCGQPCGLGQYIQNDNTYFIGFQFMGKNSCHGRIVYPDGSFYEGEWYNDQPFNKGVFYTAKGDVEMILRAPSTDEIDQTFGITFEDSVYYGDSVEGVQEGQGYQRWADGTHYIGEFKAGKRHGIGRMLFQNGNQYFGGFEKNMLHGLGYFKWAEGAFYFGRYIKNEKFGFGIYQINKSTRYEGVFKNGQLNGRVREINTRTDSMIISYWEENKKLTAEESKKRGYDVSPSE